MLALGGFMHAQDIHFSQFNGSLLNLSPGHTGLFDGDYRLSAIYRGQWYAVPVSYSSFSMNGEMRYKPDLGKPHAVGIGVLFNNDHAGYANYGGNQFYGSASYIYMARADSSLIVTIGANFGLCSLGFDYTKMTFDKQFNGFQFDPGLPTGENFGRTSQQYFDFNIGSVAQYVLNRKHKFSYALGVYHLTRPKLALQGNDVRYVDYKFSNCLGYTSPIAERTDIVAEALISNQSRYYELIPHVGLKYYMSRPENKAVSAGVCYRTRDALVVRAGYSNKTLLSGIAYDINLSRFNIASNYRGAFEVFVTYVIKNNYNFSAKKRACPSFM